MKKFKYIVHGLLLVAFVLFASGLENLYAQEKSKSKVRLSLYYVKVMNGESYFNVKATSKINKENVKVSDAEILFYNEVDDETVELGKLKTNMEGVGKFYIKKDQPIKTDSTHYYNIKASYKGNEIYKKAKKTISFKDVNIEANLIVKDSINYIEAKIYEPISDSLLVDIPLTVQLQRLFRPLKIGEEFNITDEDGTIIVSIEEEYPGVDGNLIFEVVLNESDEYGTVKALVNAPIGIPIVDESTFDERTMWSTRDKTPIFLLIFPNILIIGMWGIIIYLIFNLFKISKSKI